MSSKSNITPSLSEFQRLARTHDLVPICRRWTADLETPVSAFLRVAYGEPEAFLLESVEGGENVGRYTFMGIRPYKKIIAHGHQITTHTGDHIESSEGDVFELLRDSLAGHAPARLPGLPPFTAGAVGFFSYDAVRLIENLPDNAKDELGMPDACLMFFDTVLAFDHVKQEILLI
ncbi:MAG: anthranilate synthase component I, partial [Acidobacteriaceae bacterium]